MAYTLLMHDHVCIYSSVSSGEKLTSPDRFLHCLFDSGTMKQGASDQEWLEALSPKWPLPELCKWSWVWNKPTPPCSPGRSETGCSWSECVNTTVCPASAPSTGRWSHVYTVRLPDRQIIKMWFERVSSVFTGSSETKFSLSLVKRVSFSVTFPVSWSDRLFF